MAKFRSWIPSIQTFTYFENGVYSCPKVQFDKVPFDWGNAEQCTEINGIEFYVGDIVKNNFLTEAIRFDGGGFKVSMWYLGKRDIGKLEKIGNIHESQELLKETT